MDRPYRGRFSRSGGEFIPVAAGNRRPDRACVAGHDDLLEITSPGPLPDNLSPDSLGTGRSEIHLELGESGHAFQVRFINAGPRKTPEVTTEDTTEVRLVLALYGEMAQQAIQKVVGLKNDEHFRKAYLNPALERGLVEMTIPGKPRSGRQKYRLTRQGQEALKQLKRSKTS